MITLIFVIGFLFLVFSFATWLRDETEVLGFRKTSPQWQPTRGVGLGLIALLLPAYFVWEWHSLAQVPSNLAAYQYERKLLMDLWAYLIVLLGVLFGVRRS